MSCCNNSPEYTDQLNWSKHVPIKEVNGINFVYLTDEIEIPAAYNELIHRLYTASSDDTYNFIINSGGGVVDSAIMIIDAIHRSEATVNMFISGIAASAATIIALAGDELEIADHSSFMIHNYSAGMMGKGNELKARQNFVDKSLNAAFVDYYGNFLTEDEIERVIEGTDIWLGPEEVMERWTNRKGA